MDKTLDYVHRYTQPRTVRDRHPVALCRLMRYPALKSRQDNTAGVTAKPCP